MPEYRRILQIDPKSFLPWNDAPNFLRGKVGAVGEDIYRIKGSAKYQMLDWYNIGGRTRPITPHSFSFSVNSIPRSPFGAYSLGVVSRKGYPSINISHFLNSSGSLQEKSIQPNFYSGFGVDNQNNRKQVGQACRYDSLNHHHALSLDYDHDSETLSCYANGLRLLQIPAKLDDFFLEIRLECVGVEGDFWVDFENLYYYDHNENGGDNILALGAWDPQFAPVFVSYSHMDSVKVRSIIEQLRSQGVRVLWDWDLQYGESVIDKLSKLIQRAGYLLVALSENSVSSNWVQKEISLGLTEELDDVRVIPVLLEDCKIPPALRDKLYIDLRTERSKGFEKLLMQLRSFGVW